MRNIIWILLFIWNVFPHELLKSFVCADDEKLNENQRDIINAMELLKSLGVEYVCHPTSNEFDPFLPRCQKDIEIRNLEESSEKMTRSSLIVNSFLAALCVTAAAIAAGLTMGMLSLDYFDLHVKVRTAHSESERVQVSCLIPIIEQRHFVMVTLLLLNSVANEALPLFLDKLVPSYIAILLSVSLVLIFGEIMPSAVFTGPQQVKIASSFVPFVKFIMILFYPISYPISKFLDWLLGHETHLYNRQELAALVRVNYEQRKKNKRGSTYDKNVDSTSKFDSVNMDQVLMMEGALGLKAKTVMDVCLPMNRVYSLPDNIILNRENRTKIYLSGYSRIPVYAVSKDVQSIVATGMKSFRFSSRSVDNTQIIGVLLSKQLMLVESNDNRVLSSMPLQRPLCVPPTMNLNDLLNRFQSGTRGFKGAHFALVCRKPSIARTALDEGRPIPQKAEILGTVTLEDVLEELIQEEITDESDFREQMDRKRAAWVIAKWKTFVKKKKFIRGEHVQMTLGALAELSLNTEEESLLQTVVVTRYGT